MMKEVINFAEWATKNRKGKTGASVYDGWFWCRRCAGYLRWQSFMRSHASETADHGANNDNQEQTT